MKILQILIRAPQELKELLQSDAKSKGMTLNALILQILWSWVRENDKPRKAG